MPVWSETDVEAIRPEEAEETVKSLRADLREAAALKQSGDRKGFERARERAGKKMLAIGKMVERRFADRAERHFGDDNPHLIREAVEEAFELLCLDLMNLEPKKRFYEITFNRCALWTVVKAIREVRKRHGMRVNIKGSNDEEKKQDLKRERAHIPDSVQDREHRADEGQRVSVPVDSETQKEIERFAGPNLIRDVLERMPDHKHAKVRILHAIKRKTFGETARMTGISERTARRYYERASRIVVQTVNERR